MVQHVTQPNIEKVQQLKGAPEFGTVYAQVILQLMEQVLQVSPDETFPALEAAFKSGDYDYFKLAMRRDTGDSDEEWALWTEYIRVRHNSDFKVQLAAIMSRVQS